MGRGLSPLQKEILKGAYIQHKGPNANSLDCPDFKQGNIIRTAIWGFPFNLPAQKAATSRAVSRLVHRGLMVNLGYGWLKLTADGLKVGESLYMLALEAKREERRERREYFRQLKEEG